MTVAKENIYDQAILILDIGQAQVMHPYLRKRSVSLIRAQSSLSFNGDRSSAVSLVPVDIT